MTPKQRVLAACEFRRPDRIPRFDDFWTVPAGWAARFGDLADLTDIAIRVPLEGTFVTRRRLLKAAGGYVYEVDEWGRTIRSQRGAYFSEILAVPMPVGVNLDAVRFDPAHLDERFLLGCSDLAAAAALMAAEQKQFCVFGKTGGPFLRSTFVRGETQFLMDLVQDAPLARAIVDKVAEHLTAVGLEEIRRWGLHDTGIWIYDDMAYNHGPMFSPRAFEQVLLPAYRRMIRAYRHAGARYVFLHSDGDINLLLEMLVEAGIDGINPLERRAHMDVAAIRRRFPRLVLVGGMDNTETLIHGPISKIEAEAKEIIDLGRHGGIAIGTHSISPEIPLEHFAAYHRVCRTYGDFSPPVPAPAIAG